MEYTFRSSSAEMPTTIYLNEYNLTIRQGKQETVIPYAGVSEVVLHKSRGKVYKTLIHPEGGRPVTISNTYYTSEKSLEDRSRAYSTFIRVLHFHLKDKSKANFISGNGMKSLWISACLATALAFVVALTAGYLGFVFINLVVDGLILAAILVAIVMATRLGRFPKPYAPSDIPMDFLP